MCSHSSSGEKDITPRHLLVCVKNPGFLNVQLLQIACLCSARLTACFPQMLEPPHLLHSTSGPVLAQAGALAFLASIVTRWCSHKLEHLYSLHLSRMCLYSPHLLHLILGPVLAQAGAPASPSRRELSRARRRLYWPSSLSAHVFRLLMKFASYMCSFSLDIEVEELDPGEFS